MIPYRLLLISGFSALCLATGCSTPGAKPLAFATSRSVVFAGLNTPEGVAVKNEAVDSDAIAKGLREGVPAAAWVGEESLNRPVRLALLDGWQPPELLIFGTLRTNQAATVDWFMRESSPGGRSSTFAHTYSEGLTTSNAVNSIIQGFALLPPPPPPPETADPAPDSDASKPQSGVLVLENKEGLVRVRSTGLKPGRYFVRGAPETFENPITGETTVISTGSVLGLVEFTTVEGRKATGRIVEGEAPVGARLELEE